MDWNPLHLAAWNGNAKRVESLVFSKLFPADVNAKDTFDNTPLHLTAWKGHVEVTKILARRPKIKINIKNKYGYTPMHMASMNGHLCVVGELSNILCADINQQNDDGYTALHLAALYGHVEVARILANHPNIQLNIKDKDGRTPLDVADRLKHSEVVKVFTSACETRKLYSVSMMEPAEVYKEILTESISRSAFEFQDDMLEEVSKAILEKMAEKDVELGAMFELHVMAINKAAEKTLANRKFAFNQGGFLWGLLGMMNGGRHKGLNFPCTDLVVPDNDNIGNTIYSNLYDVLADYGTKNQPFCAAVYGYVSDVGNILDDYRSQLKPEWLLSNKTQLMKGDSVALTSATDVDWNAGSYLWVDAIRVAFFAHNPDQVEPHDGGWTMGSFAFKSTKDNGTFDGNYPYVNPKTCKAILRAEFEFDVTKSYVVRGVWYWPFLGIYGAYDKIKSEKHKSVQFKMELVTKSCHFKERSRSVISLKQANDFLQQEVQLRAMHQMLENSGKLDQFEFQREQVIEQLSNDLLGINSAANVVGRNQAAAGQAQSAARNAAWNAAERESNVKVVAPLDAIDGSGVMFTIKDADTGVEFPGIVTPTDKIRVDQMEVEVPKTAEVDQFFKDNWDTMKEMAIDIRLIKDQSAQVTKLNKKVVKLRESLDGMRGKNAEAAIQKPLAEFEQQLKSAEDILQQQKELHDKHLKQIDSMDAQIARKAVMKSVAIQIGIGALIDGGITMCISIGDEVSNYRQGKIDMSTMWANVTKSTGTVVLRGGLAVNAEDITTGELGIFTFNDFDDCSIASNIRATVLFGNGFCSLLVGAGLCIAVGAGDPYLWDTIFSFIKDYHGILETRKCKELEEVVVQKAYNMFGLTEYCYDKELVDAFRAAAIKYIRRKFGGSPQEKEKCQTKFQAAFAAYTLLRETRGMK